MKKLYRLLLALTLAAISVRADVITHWDFNSVEFDFSTATGSFEPRTGTGTAAPIGTVTNSFGSVASGGSSDPETGDNSQVRLGSFPVQGNGNKTSGLEFRTSTVGFENIRFNWDHYNSATASRYWRIQYTTDGTTWVDHDTYMNNVPTTWLNDRIVSFNSVPGANNNANFGVRLVSEFESTSTGSGPDSYDAVNEASSYGTGGTLWVDMVTIEGDIQTSNQQPTISEIVDQTVRVNTATAAIPFTIGDAETAADNLTLNYNLSDFSKVQSVEFGGTGTNRTVKITPAQDQLGDVTVTITVSDADGKSIDGIFTLSILPANTAPTISTIARQNAVQGDTVGPITFTVGDLETAAASLIVTAESSNAALLPVENITFSGNGAERTVTLALSSTAVGASQVKLIVSDGVLTATNLFVVKVNSPETIALWNFNSATSDTNSGTGTYEVAVGNGSAATTVGTVTNSFGSVAGGLTSDTEVFDNTMWRLGSFAPQSTANKSSGIEFRASTVGFENITLVWDHYNSATASRYYRIQYTTDGTTWVDHDMYANTTVTTWLIGQSVSFNSIPEANNNPNFGVRIVSEFESTATGSGPDSYDAVNEASNYGTGGTLWVDMITIGGEELDLSNTQPTITEIAAQSTRVDTATAPIVFTIGDTETPLADLTLEAIASEPSLVANFAFSGTGAERTLVITPAAGQTGETTITVRVTDAGDKFAETSFTFSVLPANTAPTISAISVQLTTRNTATGPLSFTVSDLETAVGALTLTAESSNPEVIAVTGITFGGSGADRTVDITPVSNEVGVSIITLTVSDGELTSSTSFTVKVLPGNFITLWNFNSIPADGATGTGTLEPAIGTGTFNGLGTTTNSFGTVASSGSSDPTVEDDSMLRVGSFPAQGTDNKGSGLEFRVSTVGYRHIAFMWDHYNSATASRYWRVQYSTNGMDFIDYTVFTNTVPTTWINQQVVSFKGVEGVEDNANFAVRFVSEFESTATGSGPDSYDAVNEASNYGSAGTLWTDMVAIAGETDSGTGDPVSLSVNLEGGALKISWPVSATGYALQSTVSLTNPDWQAVATTPEVVGDQNVVTIANPADTQFFRLTR